MISLKTAEFLIAFITFAFAYIVGVTTGGFAQAWAAHKMGDDTPARVGYYTWDPFVHVDFLGALLFMYAGVGWVRILPIDPVNLPNVWRRAFVYFSRAFAYCILALTSLLFLILVCGGSLVATVVAMGNAGYLSINALSDCITSQGPSWMLAMTLLLVVMLYLSVILGVLSFILDGFRFVVVTFFPDNELLKEGEIMSFIIPLILLIVFTYSLRGVILQSICFLGFFLASFLGAS